ncbi:hypothetical protein ASE04_06275 [Rhizobium sp. Root708]|nr:hypothetical protein ASE04_06275 [Rhizobium sp. Root708]
MNFLNGLIEGEAFRTNGGTILRLTPDMAKASGGRELVAGIRPEHVVLANGEGHLNGTVIVDEPTGAETQIALRIGGDEILANFRERVPVRAGDTLSIQLPSDKIHLFDKSTGQRLALGDTQ